MEYTTLSLADAAAALDGVARDAQATFGRLDARQLNWRADATRWSVAQCLQHLITSNDLMRAAARDALGRPPSSIWQRLPVLSGLFGRMLIRSQSPAGARKFTAPSKTQPAASDIPADVVPRFVAQQDELGRWMRTLDEREAARAIMTSPFVKVITYSVLDGCRLLVAHDHRHLEQARRVLMSAS